MRVKNISFVEQHIERIVLGLAAVICLVVLWLFVLGSPYKVDLGGERVPVPRVEQVVLKELNRLDRAMQGEAAGELDAIEVEGWTLNFQLRESIPVVASERFPVMIGPPGLDPDDLQQTVRLGRQYDVPVPPAPAQATARSNAHVLAEREDMVAELEVRQPDYLTANEAREAAEKEADAIIELVGGSAPLDIQDVTVMTRFDLGAYVEQLKGQQGGGKLPVGWWQPRLLIADILLERQTQDADGRWPADDVYETIAPVPGAISLRDRHGAEMAWETEDARDVLEDIRLAQREIAQPPFPPLALHSVWLPPDEDRLNLTPEQERDLYKLNSELERLRERMKRLVARSQRAAMQRQTGADPSARTPRRVNRPTRDTGRRPAGGGLEGMMGGGRRPGRSDTRGRDRDAGAATTRPRAVTPTDAERLQEQMQQTSEDINRLLIEKEELLGPDDPGAPDDAARRRVARDRSHMGASMFPGNMGALGGGYPMMPGMGGPSMRPGMGGFVPEPGSIRGGALPGATFDRRFQARRPTRNLRRPGAAARADADGKGAMQEDDQKIDVWAHDLTVVPGKTYRYRLRVRMLNPLFQRDGLAPEQKEVMWGLLGNDSDPSPWSEPVVIEPRVRFFVIAASDQSGQATVEVYRMHNGVRRSHTFKVGPGDPIGGTVEVDEGQQALSVDMGVGALAVDVEARGTLAGNLSNSHVLIYFDPQTQRLEERIAEVDRDDRDRMRLHNETVRGADERQEMRRDMPDDRAEPGPVPGRPPVF